PLSSTTTPPPHTATPSLHDALPISRSKDEELPVQREESRDTVAKQSREMMQEHIAVFRVLLNRSLEKTYGFPLQVPGHQHGLGRSEEHTSELQSRGHLVCRLLLEKK